LGTRPKIDVGPLLPLIAFISSFKEDDVSTWAIPDEETLNATREASRLIENFDWGDPSLFPLSEEERQQYISCRAYLLSFDPSNPLTFFCPSPDEKTQLKNAWTFLQTFSPSQPLSWSAPPQLHGSILALLRRLQGYAPDDPGSFPIDDSSLEAPLPLLPAVSQVADDLEELLSSGPGFLRSQVATVQQAALAQTDYLKMFRGTLTSLDEKVEDAIKSSEDFLRVELLRALDRYHAALSYLDQVPLSVSSSGSVSVLEVPSVDVPSCLVHLFAENELSPLSHVATSLG
jgi:hypothetical protein